MLILEKLKDEVNHGIFDNHQDNEIHQKDVFDFLKTVQGDVVYFDPPYPGSSAYEVEYGILDNLLVGKKLDNKPSGFSNNDVHDFFESWTKTHGFVVKKLMKKFLLPFIDKSVSFSPKKPFQILCERRVSRRELTSANLHFPNWRCFLDEVRTFFDENPNAEF